MCKLNTLQGVTSIINFPLHSDTLAVSKAIAQLLQEGWRFLQLNDKDISLVRNWEVDLNEQTCSKVA